VRDDDDLRAVLPEPPPPAPKPRDAAIAAALARFDGGSAPTARLHRPETAQWWKTLRGPQVGLIAATALVAAISLPFALRPPVPPVPATTTDNGIVPGSNNVVSSGRTESVEVPATIPAATPSTVKTGAVSIDPPSSQSYTVAPIPPPIEMAQALPASPHPPAPLAMREELPSAIVVQGRAISQIQQDTAVAISVVSSEEISDDDEGSVVVTGSRRSAENPVRRGDWNACTVNDPKRAPTRCRKLGHDAPKAVRRQVEVHLSDGLKQAWNGELDRAIAAFDAAITLAPDLATAYLNRGLVYDWQGNSGAAIADLNRAVKLSPKSARVYYNRGVLLRKYGNSKLADSDAQQAINLDSRYRAILR
jgi:Tetratricopeptide repeat